MKFINKNILFEFSKSGALMGEDIYNRSDLVPTY